MTLCGDTRALWVLDRTNGDAATIHASLTMEPYQPIFIEAIGRLTQAPADGFGVDYDGGIEVMEVTHASRIEESWGCKEKYEEFIFKAQGNEPGWTAMVTKDGIKLSSLFIEKPLTFPLTAATRAAAATTYITQTPDNSLQLTIKKGICTDSMSGELFGWQATAKLDGKELKGCAKRGDQ